MKSFALFAALLAAVVLAGCGGDDSPADSTTPVSIDDALDSRSDDPQLVSGNVLAQGDDVRLCSALAESFPPQCGGASLQVEGLDPATVDGLIVESGVSWTDHPIQLLGVVSDGTLTVSGDAG